MSTLWDKARENADSARLLLSHSLYNNACARAYYAMFTAARALLEERAKVNPEAMRRHATVLQMFSLYFVKNGPLSEISSAALARASQLRGIADYDDKPIDPDQARRVLAEMDHFLADVIACRNAVDEAS